MFGSSLILLKNMSVCERKANVAYHLVKVKKSPFFRLQSLFLRLRPDFFFFFFPQIMLVLSIQSLCS